MTVTVQTSRDVSAGNGSNQSFPTTFKFFVAADLRVTLVDSSGVETLQVITTDYTVTGGDSISGATGTVTTVGTPAVGEQLVVERILSLTQQIDYTANDPFPADINEAGLDRLTFLAQQLNDQIGRQPTLPVNFTGATPTIEAPVSGQFVVGNTAGTGYENRTAVEMGAISLPIGVADGGTGAITASAARTNLGLAFPRAVADGGTGATTADGAKTNLEIREQVIHAVDHGFDTSATAAVNTTALTDAMAAIADEGPAVIFLPRGTFTLNQINITANNVTFRGTGDYNGGTILRNNSATNTVFAFDNCQHSGCENIFFFPTIKKTDGQEIAFINDTFQCFARNVRIDNGFNGITINRGTETRLSRIQCRQMLGSFGIRFQGGSSLATASFRCIIEDYVGDQFYPGASPTAAEVITRANSTAVALGDVSLINNRIWQVTTAGTTAGSEPAGLGSIPGTTAQNAFTTTVTDGTAVWTFVSGDYTHILQESFGYSLVINKAACLNGFYGFRMDDSSVESTSYPTWAFTWDVECDHNFVQGVLASDGEGLYLDGGWIGSCLDGNGIALTTNWRGEARIMGCRIVGNAEHGVLMDSGRPNIVSNCNVFVNGQKTATTFHGITVTTNADESTITGNVIGVGAGPTTGQQDHGVNIDASANTFLIVGNTINGNVNQGISLGGNALGTFAVSQANVGTTIA
ncbi:MAG: right-handed parallel beta-helix repeat-containing protein [Pseudohongiellaceae bacterium]